VRNGRFRTNTPPVLYETVNNETIVVNLDTGSYYDLNESAGYVFGLLKDGATADEVAGRAAARYGIDADEAASDVRELLAKLVDEQLAVPAEGVAGEGAPPEPEPAPVPYAAPVINKYTDMQELLLLDPVHEVDETGWPSRA
jgi:Coenzyme PQQ synthesis protein D (PqqD)